MSGSNSICVATVVLETGLVRMTEPQSRLRLEAPGGIIDATAECRHGKARSLKVCNVPSFACYLDAQLDLEGHGRITVDTAYGGDSFVIVDADELGFELLPGEARELATLGVRIADAATEQLGFVHPENPDWTHISFCLFAAAATPAEGGLATRHAVAIRPGKIDRSPTGTGVSARLAVLHEKGLIKPGEALIARSIVDSRFIGRVESETTIDGRPAIIPSIEGRAWRTGRREIYVDPSDPWPEGYRVSDTWPGA
jgi:proline racemase